MLRCSLRAGNDHRDERRGIGCIRRRIVEPNERTRATTGGTIHGSVRGSALPREVQAGDTSAAARLLSGD
jgi:hypothetical protein